MQEINYSRQLLDYNNAPPREQLLTILTAGFIDANQEFETSCQLHCSCPLDTDYARNDTTPKLENIIQSGSIPEVPVKRMIMLLVSQALSVRLQHPSSRTRNSNV
eukprot:GHVQ01023682.1.p1 GENE.GHVQ01023682.1~~GHVQ01023682.1.p1  ORF type:complete len:105 (+),score=6.23 GHVQ01023682.1:914-1228(+)